MSPLDDLTKTWDNPPAEFRGAPFWSWNARLDPDRLCRAIESMHEAGMGGFFMHSRYGLQTPYLSDEWFRCVAACVEKARELGMKAYLYDEDRWPSGSAGGIVTRKHPEFGMRALIATGEGEPAEDAERLASFAVTLDDTGRLVGYEPVDDPASCPPGTKPLSFDAIALKPRGNFNDAPYLDTLNPEAVLEFLHVTHQAYADRYGRDFGGVIPAIFTDEPNCFNCSRWHDGVPEDGFALVWTPEMPRAFRKRRGYDLRDHLPELVYPDADGDFAKVRHDFYRTATELFVEAFSRQIGRWCDKHDLPLTGHMLAEERLESQIRVVGACMPHYEHFGWPGIDILRDQADELITAKQCTSVADQLGRPRVLSELYGCTGWDWPLEGHKFVGDWQFALGVNFRCPHLTHFSLAGGAKRDYPASIFRHSPWWTHYDVVEDYFARLSFLLTRGRPVRDVAVLHPVESAWGCFHAAGDLEAVGELDEELATLTRWLSGQHYDWDFLDESLLADHGEADGDRLGVGQMSYRVVVVPPSITLRGSTVELLERFRDGGGKLLFVGRRPDRVDAQLDERPAVLAGKSAACDGSADLPAAVEGLLDRRVSIADPDAGEATCVWAMLRKVDGAHVLFAQSHDRDNARDVRVRIVGASGPAVLWDARTGGRTRLDATIDGKGPGRSVAFDLHLPPTGSAVVTLGENVDGATAPRPSPAVAEARILDGPFPAERTEPNTMPLDYCAYAFGDDEYGEAMPVLAAEAEIRGRFDLPSRVGAGHQPWYLYAMGTVDTTPRGPCRLRFGVHVTDVPARCALAIERPEDFTVLVNGAEAPAADGWWVDEDIRTIEIADLLTAGDNEIVLAMDYRADHELEALHLVGEFDVALRAGDAPAPGGMTLIAPGRELGLGSWVGQGLDFYGGSVKYTLTIDRPADRGVRLRLPGIDCTAAAVHAGGRTFVLPWRPFEVDLTDALVAGENTVVVEVFGGRKNILGPLHVPWKAWTGPGEFSPNNADWTDAYQLCHHGLHQPPVVEVLD